MPFEPLSRADLDAAQEALGVPFKNAALLALSLTHRSFVNENPAYGGESNERLEFLGDGVINLVAGLRLFELIPEAAEGELTARRAGVVNREALGEAARRLGLGKFLVMGKGEAASGGAERTSNLANALEAAAGAILLDRGFVEANAFILRALEVEITSSARSHPHKDPKSILQERLQARGVKSPEYTVASVAGADHERHYVIEVIIGGRVIGRGEGRRKVDAERAAAADAVAQLDASGGGQLPNAE